MNSNHFHAATLKKKKKHTALTETTWMHPEPAQTTLKLPWSSGPVPLQKAPPLPPNLPCPAAGKSSSINQQRSKDNPPSSVDYSQTKKHTKKERHRAFSGHTTQWGLCETPRAFVASLKQVCSLLRRHLCPPFSCQSSNRQEPLFFFKNKQGFPPKITAKTSSFAETAAASSTANRRQLNVEKKKGAECMTQSGEGRQGFINSI